MKLSIKEAVSDVIDGAMNYEFWMTFGMNDIKAKYRRSKLGQLWITLSVAAFIFVIGGLYRGIFDADAGTYMAYLAIGYITWLLIQDSINSGCMVIASAKPFLLQKKWPISTFAYRLIYREILIFAHHAVLIPPIFLWLGFWPGFDGVIFGLLGLALTIFTAFWVVMLLALMSLRYRDFPPIVQSLMRMAFFATPIIWVERNLGEFGDLVVLLNPFGYFLAIVREPLLGRPFPLEAWAIATPIALVTMMISLIALTITKDRVTYWL